MNPVLSQEEIDALMEGMKQGTLDTQTLAEPEKPKAKPYDFRRPARLSKEYMSTLNMVFEDYSKMVGNLLTTQVRTTISLELKSMEQVSFDEFLNSMPPFTMMGIFHSAPQPGIQIVELNPQICFQLVELLCGNADGRNPMKIVKRDHFTDIELAILEEVVLHFGTAFQNAWRDILPLETTMASMETNAQMIQAMSPNEPVTMLTFEIEMLGTRSFINLCIPYIFFESILDKLSLKNWFHTGKGSDASEKGKLERNLNAVPLQLKVLLGQTKISLDNFLQLELGDIVPLDGKITEPMVMEVENEPYYLVKPGLVGSQVAVEVLKELGGNSEE